MDLAERLGIPECFAVGVLECFWHWVAKERPDGDVSGVRPGFLARAMRYPGDAQAMWESLVGARWIDVLPDGRAIVHDWSEHADNAVHQLLKKRGQAFADGHGPFERLKVRGGKDEPSQVSESRPGAPVIETAQREFMNRSQTVHEPFTNGLCLPVPLPVPEPVPEKKHTPPTPRDAGGGGAAGKKRRRSENPALTPAIDAVAAACGVTDPHLRRVLDAQIALEVDRGEPPGGAASAMIAAWKQFVEVAWALRIAWGPINFFGHGHWRTPEAWPIDHGQVERRNRAREGTS